MSVSFLCETCRSCVRLCAHRWHHTVLQLVRHQSLVSASLFFTAGLCLNRCLLLFCCWKVCMYINKRRRRGFLFLCCFFFNDVINLYLARNAIWVFVPLAGPGGDMQWCFSQVKGAIDDDVAEGMNCDLRGKKSVRHVGKICRCVKILSKH